MAKECPECWGEGETTIDGEAYRCEVCDGTGEVELEDLHDVVKDIPFGKCEECGSQLATVQIGRDVGVECRGCDNYHKHL